MPEAKSDADRKRVASEIVKRALDEQGDAVLGIVICGSVARGYDGPCSDLDLTVVTEPDLGHLTCAEIVDGLLVQTDYQTLAESEAEAQAPLEAGNWIECVVLCDFGDTIGELKQAASSISDSKCQEAAMKILGDQIPAFIGKARNALKSKDNRTVLHALSDAGNWFCKAICLNYGALPTGNVLNRSRAEELEGTSSIRGLALKALLDSDSPDIALQAGLELYRELTIDHRISAVEPAMAIEEQDSGWSPKPGKKVVVKLDDIADALQMHMDEGIQFLDLETGMVGLYYDGMLNGEEVDIDFDFDEHMDAERCGVIRGLPSHEGYAMMKEFIQALPEGHARNALERAIQGRKPFSRFKDALHDFEDIRQQWFTFEAAEYRRLARVWLEEEGIDAE